MATGKKAASDAGRILRNREIDKKGKRSRRRIWRSIVVQPRANEKSKRRGLTMADYRIDCVHKPDRSSRHESITHVGGPKPDGTGRWRDTTANVVAFIEGNQHRFYTPERGAKARVGVRTSATELASALVVEIG